MVILWSWRRWMMRCLEFLVLAGWLFYGLEFPWLVYPPKNYIDILPFLNGTFESMILNFPTLGGIWYGICDFFLDGDHFNHHFFSQRHRWQSEITKDGKIREGLGTVPWFMSRKPNGQRKGWCRVTSYLKPMKDGIFHLARLLFCFYFFGGEDFHVEDLLGYLDNSTTMIDSQRVGVFRFF